MDLSSFGYVVLVTFWPVFVAELVGDKSIYTITSLSLRFRTSVILTGITVAFAGKMMAAVLLGKLIVQLHSEWTDALSAVAFFSSALFIWFKEPEPMATEGSVRAGWWRAAAICFSALFLTEWGDPGQIAAAALAMQSHSLAATCGGGPLAMLATAGLALVAVIQVRYP